MIISCGRSGMDLSDQPRSFSRIAIAINSFQVDPLTKSARLQISSNSRLGIKESLVNVGENFIKFLSVCPTDEAALGPSRTKLVIPSLFRNRHRLFGAAEYAVSFENEDSLR